MGPLSTIILIFSNSLGLIPAAYIYKLPSSKNASSYSSEFKRIVKFFDIVDEISFANSLVIRLSYAEIRDRELIRPY